MLGAFAVTACVPTAPAPLPDAPLAGPFHVEDDGEGRPPRLIDAAVGTVLLRGVNLSQTAKSPPDVALEVDTPEGREALAAEDPLALRLLPSWMAIEPHDPRLGRVRSNRRGPHTLVVRFSTTVPS
jgi:hypothetical protein